MPKLQEQLRIFIPTRGRVNKQTTIKQFGLGPVSLPWTTVVVPECEAGLIDVYERTGITELMVPDNYKFSDIRQFILRQDGKYHIVIDDDLYPAVRREDDPTKFTNFEVLDEESRKHHLFTLFSLIQELLDEGWVHGGISPRQGANYDTDPFQVVGREMRFHFYNAEVVRKLGYDFRRVVIKQDLDFTLWMLERGIPNILINSYVQEQVGNNVEGGCSRYRNDQVLKEGAVKLAALHPQFVKVVEKHPKKAWGGKPRVDVNIQWKKAYKHGLENTSLKSGVYMSGVRSWK